MAKLSEYFSIEHSALFLYDPEQDLLTGEALYGLGKEDHLRGYVQRKGVIRRVFESCQPIVIQDRGQEPFYQKIKPPILCVPILADHAPIGVLAANPFYGGKGELTEGLQFLSILSVILSPTIRHFQASKPEPLARPEISKLKFSLLGESLEKKLIEIVDKLAPYAEPEAHIAILDDIVAVVERILIKSALEKVGYVQLSAARLLGMNRNTLRKKIRDLKIKPAHSFSRMAKARGKR